MEPAAQSETLTAIQIEIADLKTRLATLEQAFETAKGERTKMMQLVQSVSDQQAQITAFLEGTDHVLGFCRKHWRTILHFSAGVVMAYGITNPHVQAALNFIVQTVGG